MSKMKSTKMSADNGNSLYKLLKGNINDKYYLEVLYYHVRKALIRTNFNLSDVDAFTISGKYLGYDINVDLNKKINGVVGSLNLALSLRAFILNEKYIRYAYDNKLLFGNINSGFLSWDSHRVIMECMDDEDFSSIYHMILNYLDNRCLSEEDLDIFKEKTIDPGYHHFEEFCKKLAAREDYHGRTVIKNNTFLYSDIEQYVVNKVVEYVGNTVFAYCENLRELKFEGKVQFGQFPIIECNNLNRIVVPTELLEYYKTMLPYYKDIITDNEQEHQDAPNYDDLEIEHVYLDVTSADPFSEKEVEQTESESETEIDFSTLEKVFDKKASSYKYFWFLSIISLAKQKNSLELSYKDILVRMASMAWPLVLEIDFGSHDMIPNYLNRIEEEAALTPMSSSITVEKYLSQNYVSRGIDTILNPLLKNVPYRFLSPWVKYTTDAEVVETSNRRDFAGLYALSKDHISLNANWWNYIQNHYSDICGKAVKSFIDYIKQYNNDKKLLALKMNGLSFIGSPH